MEAGVRTAERTWSRTVILAAIGLGLSLTLNGYVSRDGDQAYRLPLLLHHQNPSLFRHDPFVQALHTFNPHTHFLQLIDVAGRPLGLSAALFLLYAATFFLTFVSIDTLARRVWPEISPSVGLVAAALVFSAKAGNIGTNHLFEPLLLDRLIALAFGWSALAMALSRSPRVQMLSTLPIGLAAWVHPSLGLQMGMWLAGCWVVWACLESRPRLVSFAPLIGIALYPGLAGVDSSRLFEGLPADQFRVLTAYIQSPQHMIPRLWRTPQWLAAFCYPALALLGMSLQVRDGGPDESRTPSARRRLLIALGLIVLGLIVATIAIESLGNFRVTLIQPFRMATIGRGLCLVLLAPHVFTLGRRPDFAGNVRAAWIFVGLLGDWTLAVVTCVEIACVLTERFSGDLWTGSKTAGLRRPGRLYGTLGISAVIVAGLLFLAFRDTESGHVRLLVATVGVWLARGILGRRQLPLTTSRLLRIACYCWLIPVAAVMVPLTQTDRSSDNVLSRFLVARCRFGETPTHDVERLALWCRDHTPEDAVFIGPPGPKTFRLWSGRSLAFNRAGSPYHAAGIADWAERFREHVGFHGPLDAFAAAYLNDRQALERRYDQFDARELADLARRQKAEYVITQDSTEHRGRLQRLHVEGRYAVYRVVPVVVTRSAGTG